MAKKIMTPVEAPYNAITKVTFEAATVVADGLECKVSNTDEYVLMLATNTDTAAKKVTVKAPTKGFYAARDTDLELSLAAGETAVIRLESVKYCNTDGTVNVIPEALTVKVAAIY